MIRRIALALVLALGVSTGLFWLMHTLIAGNRPDLRDVADYKVVDFVRLKRDTAPETRERRLPEEPPPPKEPPPLKKLDVAEVEAPSPDNIDIDMPALDLPVQLGEGALLSGVSPGGTGSGSQGLTPLVRIAPQYPMRAAMDGIEGWVKVAFTITAEGTVADVEVVDSQPRRVFDRAALRAILKWKFKPPVVDGEPVPQRAVQTLEFNLDQ